MCLEGRVDRIAALCRNSAGDALMTMINSGVRHLAMTKADQAVAERCHRILSVEHDIGRKVAAHLALSLFSFPHSVERSFDIVDVPNPLLTTVVKVLLAVPLFFTRDGARRRALAHVEATVQKIGQVKTAPDLGAIQITSEEKHKFPIPAIAAGLAVAAGLVLVVMGARKA